MKNELQLKSKLRTESETIQLINDYMHFYNFERPHQNLDYKIPMNIRNDIEYNKFIVLPEVIFCAKIG